MRQANHEAVALAETKISGVLFDLDDGQPIQPASRLSELLDFFVAKKQIEDAVSVELAWTRSLLLAGDLAEAQRHFRSAKAKAAQTGDVTLESDFIPVFARLSAAQGDRRRAEVLLDGAIARASASGNVAPRWTCESRSSKSATSA
ncbi:hypothetical protein [Terriglobus aquaticus]|uniref:Uncharacterized protein n=1 Tax=Terriglobus aquaticus TaxID=940139 RepID=A0ABW9KH39_9BACT|nr:hypothetical protein [Terriglobus aquaticus]